MKLFYCVLLGLLCSSESRFLRRGANATQVVVQRGGESSPHEAFEGKTDPLGPKPDWVDNPLAEYFFHYTEGPMIWKWHHYFRVYHKHLARFAALPPTQPINMLVVGVQSGGEIGMWQSYFGSRVHFTGVDINPGCKALEAKYANAKILTGDQGSSVFLASLPAQVPHPIHIIIDDGSHINAHQILTFETLFPMLDPNGVFITEDTTTSFSDPAGDHRTVGVDGGVGNPEWTLVEHMKHRVTSVNGYWANPTEAPQDPFVTSVESIAFYDGMVVTEKRPHAHPLQERRGTDEIPYCTPGQSNGCLT